MFLERNLGVKVVVCGNDGRVVCVYIVVGWLRVCIVSISYLGE